MSLKDYGRVRLGSQQMLSHFVFPHCLQVNMNHHHDVGILSSPCHEHLIAWNRPRA